MLRTLGRSDIKISAIGLGVWQFSEASGFHKLFWNMISEVERTAIIETAFKSGINWFDTAEVYGNGRSERGLANSLNALNIPDTSVIIATKWRPHLRRAGSISKTFPKRKENLSPYSIDLLQIHHPYSLSSVENQMKEMIKLLDDKKIKSVGVSNFSAKKMVKAHETLEEYGYLLSANQVKFNPFYRKIESNGILDKAKELGITIVAYSPLEMGLASGKFHEKNEMIKSVPFLRRRSIKNKISKTNKAINLLRELASNYEVSISQIVLNWIINFSDDTIVAIPGASKQSQVIENAQSMKFELSKSDMSEIEEYTQEFL
jgi:aryl-alcohol dehydrogenase-like predicted oxidoreductase